MALPDAEFLDGVSLTENDRYSYLSVSIRSTVPAFIVGIPRNRPMEMDTIGPPRIDQSSLAVARGLTLRYVHRGNVEAKRIVHLLVGGASSHNSKITMMRMRSSRS